MQLVVARIGRAHGIKGEVTVEVRTDEPELRLAPGAVLATDPASAGPLTIETGRVHSGRLLLRFEGVRDRTGAEALRNTLLIADVDPEERPDGSEVMIPFVESIVTEIDLEEQRAVIDPPPGLIDDRAEVAGARDTAGDES